LPVPGLQHRACGLLPQHAGEETQTDPARLRRGLRRDQTLDARRRPRAARTGQAARGGIQAVPWRIKVITPWPLLAVAAICAASGFAAGYALKGRFASAEIARIEAAHAAQQQAAAEEAARRLAAAQDAERAAVHALQATKNRLAAANRKLKEALYGLPTAAECGLSGPARGLLNRALDPAAAPMPTDTGGAAG